MEPDYRSGDLIFADTGIQLDSLKEGEVIVYQGYTRELTRYQGNCRMKANRSSASVEISSSQVLGRVVFSIPWAGNAVEFFLGHCFLAWLLIAGLLLRALLPRKLFSRYSHPISMKKEDDNGILCLPVSGPEHCPGPRQ